ncbi:PBSX family phage terminase large subunit [Paenibacillus chitinolyticus]|uniref:PBSX family phage terminase large subunit n=1 Tax=Paenibacillus chitinolyticus TaxID=79263 RepID=UPI003671A279
MIAQLKTIELTGLIAPSFYGVPHALKTQQYTHYWLKGGRGSTKSSFISVEIILGIMADPNANAMVVRKVKITLRESVFEQLAWAIEKLGVFHLWEIPKAKLELIYLPTSQKILFRGADDPKKIKSAKVSKGYFKYVWFKEVDEFGGMEEIRTINQTLLRGGEKFVVFYSFNPQKSQRNWVNTEVTEQRSDRLVHHSTYLTVPPEWLRPQFIFEAEHLKKTKPESYRHEYLGEVVGTGGVVFTNLTFREITDEEISIFDRIRRGLDFGYAKDPAHYGVMHYDKTRRRLYIFHELHQVQLSNRKLAEHIKAENKSNG